MIRVLGVADPAVLTYTDKKNKILTNWKEQTGIDIDFSILPWADYFPALMKTLEKGAGGESSNYDIIMVAGHLWLQDFINRGFLQPLEGIKEAVNEHAAYDDLLPKVREEIEVDGRTWLIPSFTDGHIIFYKKDRITAVNGTALPETLAPSEYLALVRKIGNHPVGKGRRFLAMKADPSEIFLDWLPFYFETSPVLFDEEINPLFNTPAAVEALTRYLELKPYTLPGAESAGNEAVCEALQSEECFLGVSWGGQASFIMNDKMLQEENVGFSTFNTPWNVSWSFGVPSGAQFTEENRAFLAYLISPEVDAVIGAGAGSPVRNSSYEGEHLRQPWFPIQKKMVSLAHALPGFTGSGDIYGLFYKWIARAYRGEADPKTALNELATEVVQELKKIH